jgi:hypothetical protein
MKKVGIICNLMTGYGGVQVCVLELMKELNSMHIIPELISNVEPNFKLIDNEGIKWTYKHVDYSLKASTFKKYSKVLSPVIEFVYYFKTSWLHGKYDFIYFFQPNIMIDDDTDHLGYLSNSPKSHYVKSTFRSKIKRFVYNNLVKFFHPIFEHDRYNCVINSKFTAQIFKDFYHKKLEVVYPPNALNLDEHEPKIIEKTVISFSRICSAKRFELIFKLAKNQSNYQFFIAGALSDADGLYYKTLLEKSKQMGLSNVKFILNPAYGDAIKLISSCEYYVFFAQNEHFGITTVEAINLGCIPFVHNSGGQKEIVPLKNLRFDDQSMETKFDQLLALNKEERNETLSTLKELMKSFDSKVYREKLVSFLSFKNE